MQVPIDASSLILGIQEQSPWLDALVLPPAFCVLSAFALIGQFAFSKLPSTIYPSNGRFGANGAGAISTSSPGLLGYIHSQAEHLGGLSIFIFRVSRLFSTLILLALAIANVPAHLDISLSQAFTSLDPDVILHVVLCATFAYASALASTALSRRPIEQLANTHLICVLLVWWATYAYRDLYPLATYHLAPADSGEGWILWLKIGVLSFAAVIVPLVIPSQYMPVDSKDLVHEPSPEQTASWASFLLYIFLDPLVIKASRTPHLPASELPVLPDYDHASYLVKNSFKHLDPLSPNSKQSLSWGLLRVFRRECIILSVQLVNWATVAFLNPIAINRLLNYLETDGKGASIRPWFWIALIFVSSFTGSLNLASYFFVATRSMIRVQGIITQLVFEHALRIRMKAETETIPAPLSETASTAEANHKGTPASGEKSTDLIGKINNLISSDLANIIAGQNFLLIVVACPLRVICCTSFLFVILGWSAIPGMVAMLLLFPVPGYLTKLMRGVQVEKMKKSDARIQSVTEAMSVVRMIKLFGYESKMDDRLAAKRNEELKSQRKLRTLEILSGTINYLIPVVTMIVSLGCYTLVMKQDLTASRVFSAITVFDMLREQMIMIFFIIPAIIKAKVSIDRVGEFLRDTELLDSFTKTKESVIPLNTNSSSHLIGFRDVTFTWSNEPRDSGTPGSSRKNFALRIDGELLFKEGKINCVVGPTGSGKTSLLMALLYELHYIPSGPDSWFNLPRAGGVAYAAQESWVQNDTIKNNIVFGAAFDEMRYKKVLEQCALVQDLQLFDAGDDTEVGEKGLSLSGGQKARITLARAVYSSARILLLDDVLAALDVHTSRWIVEKCFCGDLIHGRTVILVTHNIALTSPIANFVVSLRKDGTIASQGSMTTAVKVNAEVSSELEHNKDEMKLAEEQIDSEILPAPTKEANGKLILAEEIAEGNVGWSSLKFLFVGMGGSNVLGFWISAVGGLGLMQLATVVQTWYLGYWSSQYENSPDGQVPVAWHLGVYSTLLVLAALIYGISMGVFTLGSLRASRSVHKALIQSILGSTLRWLDTTPVSRVITRCTQDIQAVDGPVMTWLQGALEMFLGIIIKLGAVLLYSPIFAFPGLAVAFVGLWCGKTFVKAQLCVKREMSNARAPVLAHFGAAISSIVSIRAYQAQDSFKRESLTRIDKYTLTARSHEALNRWIAVRADTLGALFSTSLATYLIYRPGSQAGAAEIGFSLNMAVGFSSLILVFVRMFTEFQIAANSVERIYGYTVIEQEPKPTKTGVPPAYWPASGDLRVENLHASYTKDGPKVLQDVSFHVSSGERVAVVGRTGSGKSSLTLALLRCINTGGNMYLDNLPIEKVNLDALRSSITIIPQTPELLSGTLRDNLDPFSQHDDATLNEALRSAGLFSIQNDEEGGRITLDTSIASGGSNFSVGQRQIIALARAIVRGSKLLILDEATSAIDYQTDAVIQASLRHELGKDVTLFTVAHRLQTIMDADKIMVLDAGRVVEFGKPSELLQKEQGKLRSMVDESSDKEVLYDMAMRGAA